MPIAGCRYNCQSCDSYDLCNDCFNAYEHPQHEEFRLKRNPAAEWRQVKRRNRQQPSQVTETKVSSPTIPQKRPSSVVEEQKNVAASLGSECGNCRCGLTGAEYRCLGCAQYSLCYDCYENGAHSNHLSFAIVMNGTIFTQIKRERPDAAAPPRYN